MLFNSIDFALFLPVVFALYWLLNRYLRLQNLFIVLASYVFYGWWDWRFLSLILFSTVVDYSVGLALARTGTRSRRRALLWTSIAVNLGFLGFFKYYNFFLENFVSAFSIFGTEFHPATLAIILPVGISFYTFQTLSYTIDIYRKKLIPTKDFISFAAFVSFFPQLVAGPIERAANLLPQFFARRTFDYHKATDGLRQILWGLFKKVVIADNCARIVDPIFASPESYGGSALLLGAVFFAIQIYGDFSGYSDMAIGTARLFGFTLMRNFAFPYFSRDIAEFWRRWHISLSTWFRDYVYIPLGGSRGSMWMKVRNTFIIFLVSGFWHGANWTFIFWGGLNAVFFLPLLLSRRHRDHLDVVAAHRWLPSLREIASIGITFLLTVIAWIFFRSPDIGSAFTYITGMADQTLFWMPSVSEMAFTLTVFILILGFLLVEWLGRREPYAIASMGAGWWRPLRWTGYSFILFIIGLFLPTTETPFIYFQF